MELKGLNSTLFALRIMAQREYEANSIHLQSIGRVPAIPAKDLKIGDVTMWNFGYREIIETVELRGKSVYVTLRDPKSGNLYDRRFLATRMVARI